MSAVATEKPKVEAAKKAATMFYWTGALPVIGEFNHKVASLERKPLLAENDAGEYFTYERATALALWDSRGEWAGKCKYAQNVTVHGHDYQAVSYRRIEEKGDNNTRHLTFDPTPGVVVKWTKAQLQAIIKATENTYQREMNGKDAPNNTPMTVRFLDYVLLHSMDHRIDKTGKDPRLADYRTDDFEYNPELDTCVTEYVYIVPLPNADPKTKPEDYWNLTQTTLNQFFANPPKSLADALKAGELS